MSVQKPGKPKPTVLVVDSERVIADTLAIILRQSGFRSSVAYDGETGFQRARELKPDMIISFAVYLGLDVIDMAIQIREEFPGVKILVFSGMVFTSEFLLEHARGKGHDLDMAQLPLHPANLLAWCESWGRHDVQRSPGDCPCTWCFDLNAKKSSANPLGGEQSSAISGALESEDDLSVPKVDGGTKPVNDEHHGSIDRRDRAPDVSAPEAQSTDAEDERGSRIMAFIGATEMRIDRTHIKALLKHPETREKMLAYLDDKSIISAGIESLSPSDLAVLQDAALDLFGNEEVPIVKKFAARGDFGEYPIEIMGVRGAYMVRALEHDNKGFFATLKDAKSYIALNWWGEARER